MTFQAFSRLAMFFPGLEIKSHGRWRPWSGFTRCIPDDYVHDLMKYYHDHLKQRTLEVLLRSPFHCRILSSNDHFCLINHVVEDLEVVVSVYLSRVWTNESFTDPFVKIQNAHKLGLESFLNVGRTVLA